MVSCQRAGRRRDPEDQTVEWPEPVAALKKSEEVGQELATPGKEAVEVVVGEEHPPDKPMRSRTQAAAAAEVVAAWKVM